MRTGFDYTDFCLRQTFGRSFEPELLSVGDLIDAAVKAAMVDAAAKYSGRNVVASEAELVELMALDAAIEATFLYRMQRALFLARPDAPLLAWLASAMRRRTGCELYYSSEIGPELNVQHGFGIVLGPRNKIGARFTIHQGVTLGQRRLGAPHERMVIGNDVTVFAGATLLGSLQIGDGAKIGAHAVVLTDIEPGAVYAGAPAKRVG